MKNFLNYFLILVLFGMSSFAYAKLRITKVNFQKESVEEPAKVIVHFTGKLEEIPEITTRSKMVQLALTEAVVWPKIEKKITLGKLPFDSTLMAYQFDRNLVRVRINLPYSITGNENLAKYDVKNSTIILTIPRKAKKLSQAQKKKNMLKYDETYLTNLLKDKKDDSNLKLMPNSDKSKSKKSDYVKTNMSAIKKAKDSIVSSFSISKYVGKFLGFLGVVIILFYGVVTLFKKGVTRKGKLGFLNNMKPINVLSTTYLGPKKQLVLVKVQDQVLLLGSSDKGINFLTEIKDVNALLKNGEKSIAGENFDTNLETAEHKNKEMKLKETISESAPNNHLEKFLSNTNKKDKVKLSDKIKSKVKDLKPLQ